MTFVCREKKNTIMLSGKVVLVTGAAQGIGYAIASALISNGAKVNHRPGHLYLHLRGP